jgi:PBSX family phage terminase large subunit
LAWFGAAWYGANGQKIFGSGSNRFTTGLFINGMAPTDTLIADAARPVAKIRPFGRKAAKFIARTPEEDARMNILVGAVRSAKTWAVMTKIIALCFYEVAGQKVITGASKQAIVRNVLTDLFDIVGEGNYTYNRQSGELTLLGCKWIVLGSGDEGSEKVLRGMTIGAVVCDEIILMARSFCMQLMARMSPAGARLYATTNPDSPYHWLKQEILDSPDLIKGLKGDIWWETWTMDDNPNLTEEFKAFARRKYTGIFQKRFIDGLWVLASGSVFRDVLTEDLFYDESTRLPALENRGYERWIAIDVGTVNAFAALDIYDDSTTLFWDNELYWDSRAMSQQKTNAEYADDLINGCGQWPGFGKEQRTWPGVIIDPSAASFRIELLNRGVFVKDAVNDVLEGISKMCTLMARKRIRIHRRCINTHQELETYSWNDKKALTTGKEEPIKSHDHTVDAGRYASSTLVNDWRLAA